MKLHYYPETDSLYIELKSAPGTQTREIVEGLLVDLDAKGDVVGFDIDHASRKLDSSSSHAGTSDSGTKRPPNSPKRPVADGSAISDIIYSSSSAQS